MNTYIAVILDNFMELFEQEKLGATNEDLESFYGTWSRFDPDATQFIPIDQLPDLLDQLSPPFKVGKPNSIKIAGLDIKIMEGEVVHCLDVITKLFCRVVEDSGIEDEDGNVYRTWNEVKQDSVGKHFLKRVERKEVSSTQELKNMEVAARVIQRNWKKKRNADIIGIVKRAGLASRSEGRNK